MDIQHVTANGIDVAYFATGEDDAPLAICLHGYPDTAHTWRHLMPRLAAAGYRAVAPFNRGYAPSGFAGDGQYEAGTLGVDANALHEALGGDERAVLVGHDWGAMGTYAAAGLEPERWRRIVAMAVPPGPVMAEAFFSYEQLRRSWYMFFQLTPLADMVMPLDDFDFIRRLWADWSPGYDATADVAHFAAAMGGHDHVVAALSAYRHTLQPELQSPDYAAAQTATLTVPDVPLLYLHGADDGCIGADIAGRSAELLTGDSRFEMVAGAGHFLQLEQPDRVNELILDYLEA
jgi:pimeloyl-ACP methyl ester carboxylesterase